MSTRQADIQIFNNTTISLPFPSSMPYSLAYTVAKREECNFKFIELVYVSEEEIVRINKAHLGRDYVTDVITFRYDDSSDKDNIEGTIFCCAPRIIEQARDFNESTEREFLRIYIHGLLHLIGYDDKNSSQKREMTLQEDHYLALIAQ